MQKVHLGGLGGFSGEHARRFSVFRVVLWGNILLAFVATINNFLILSSQDLLSEFLPLLVFLLLVGLHYFSKITLRGASMILVMGYSLIAYYLAYRWGTIIPQSWIILSLSIVMGGILLSSRFVLFLLFLHSSVLFLLTSAQMRGVVAYEHWDSAPEFGSVVVALITFSIIALVSWLSNRELEKSLRRAITSEKALRKERDLLEVRVEQRTLELKQSQLEKMMQIYRFVEFGRAAGGLFHDLASPLTTVSMNLEQMKNKKNPILARALVGAKSMEKFVKSARAQLQKQEEKKYFLPDREIQNALSVLKYKALENKIRIVYGGQKKSRKLYGNPLKFNQVIMNVVSNAIDSYELVKRKEDGRVKISLEGDRKQARIVIQDWGSGIDDKIQLEIFKPLFTTKNVDAGTGLGLYISRKIIRKDFGGDISFSSKKDEGTKFVIKAPWKRS